MPQPRADSNDAIAVGWILGAHATSGQVRVRIHSDAPRRFDAGQTLYCDELALRIVSTAGATRNRIILQFEGIDTTSAARSLEGRWLTVPRDEVDDLPEGEYFHFQLLGLRVVTVDGETLGEVAEIIETGSNDVYVVNSPEGQVLIPAIASVVQEVDLEQGLMKVSLMEGMR